jgi:hypothetical protein
MVKRRRSVCRSDYRPQRTKGEGQAITSTQKDENREAQPVRVRGRDQAYITGFLETAREFNPREPLLNPKHPKFHSRLQEISSRVMPRIIEYLHHRTTDAPTRWVADHDEKTQKDSALEQTWREYLPFPGRYTKGGREDLRGSFFLTAVTEHLGEARGRYRLAGELLRHIRSYYLKKGQRTQTPIGELTRIRVRSFKNDHRTGKHI